MSWEDASASSIFRGGIDVEGAPDAYTVTAVSGERCQQLAGDVDRSLLLCLPLVTPDSIWDAGRAAPSS